MLDLNAILTAKDQQTEKLTIPEWGGEIYVKGMTAFARDKFEQAHLNNKLTNYRATVAVHSICDENGELLFNETHIPELAKKSAKALDRVFEVSMRLSGITDKDIEELEKN